MFDGVSMPWNVTAGGLVGMVVMLVMFGGLIPRWTHVQRIRDKDQVIASLEASLAKRNEQTERLIANNELTLRLLEDIKDQVGQRRRP